VIYLATFGLQLDDSRLKQRSTRSRGAGEFHHGHRRAGCCSYAPDRVQLVIDEAFTPPLSNVASQAAAQVEVPEWQRTR